MTMLNPIEQYSDIREGQRSFAGLRSSREAFLAAIDSHSDSGSFADIESTGFELLHKVEIAELKLRCSLSVVKLRYTILWVRRSVQERWNGSPTDVPAPDPMEKALGMMEQFLERRIEETKSASEETCSAPEGHSDEAGIRVAVDSNMRLVALGFDPAKLPHADYKAALIKTVNASLAKVFARRDTLSGKLFTDAASEEPPSWLDVREQERQVEARLCLEVYRDLAAAKAELEDKLPQIANLEALDHLKEVAECVSCAEKGFALHASSLAQTRDLLEAKSSQLRINSADLSEFDNVRRIFLVEDLTPEEYPLELQDQANAAQQWLEAVTAEIEDQEEAEASQRSWQTMSYGRRQRLAEVDGQIFEGRSQNALVTATVTGGMQLVGFDLGSTVQLETEQTCSDLIEAINEALSEASHRRTLASMVVLV